VESSLADTYRDVIGSIGAEAGWGRGPDNGDEEWDATKFTTLKLVMKSGLRQFYKPPPDQSGVSHQWSFLSPRTLLTLPSGSRELLLPFDFGGVEGPLNLVTTSGGSPGQIRVTGGVRARYATHPSATGRPCYAEIEPLRHVDKGKGQRWQMVFYPEPNAEFTIELNYSIIGEMLTGELPYAYGGADHSETILASCLAIWENRQDDIDQGPRYKFWRERLAASISFDRLKRSQNLGYNGDRSDARYEGRSNRSGRGWGATFLYNGVPLD
jgi:hypothetical protein